MNAAETWPAQPRVPLPAMTAWATPPPPMTSLIAREREIAEIAALLQRDDLRLLTLTGPGGVGKTRLAIAVIDALEPGVCDGFTYVELAPIREASLVTAALAQALGISVRETPSAGEAAARAIGRSHWLLVLDNFEHILPAALDLAALLRRCPNLKILVTSRASLHLSGEQVYPVLPLASGAAGEVSPAETPAVRLFIERARAVDPGFAVSAERAHVLADICARLDGLPLAIELAAARSKVLAPELLLPRLDHRLPLLSGGPHDAPARLQTMQAAIAWSYDLLSEPERAVFRHLAVFIGGFDLAAAETVCGSNDETARVIGTAHALLDAISSLVDKGLVQPAGGNPRGPRFILLETIREFGLECLAAAGELEGAQAAHARHFASLDAGVDPHVTAPGERYDDRLLALEAEFPNFRAAITWLMQQGDGIAVTRLAGALAVFVHQRGELEEAWRWIAWGLAHSPDTPSAWRARALAGLSLMCWAQGEAAGTASFAEQAQVMAERAQDADLIALAIHMRGIAAYAVGDLEQARRLMEETRARQLELQQVSSGSMATFVLAGIAYDQGNLDHSEQQARHALALFRRLGNQAGEAATRELLARIALARNQPGAALADYQEALRLWVQRDARWQAMTGSPGAQQAAEFPRWASVDLRRMIVQAFTGIAILAMRAGRPADTAILLGAVEARRGTAAMMTSRRPDSGAHARASAIAALGQARFDAAFQTGLALPLADAITLALSAPGHTAAPAAHGLTSRQLEVLRLICAGRSDREIAETLFISYRTAQDHTSNVLHKLGATSRAEAAIRAMREGLI
ncbi:MAG: LuxR C-terminal-related transcriptional regulator [Thermomicrobiales bacterium]